MENEMNEVTIIIKTFERKKSLICLLNSIQKFYPNFPIVIVDDSKINYKNEIINKFKNLNIDYIITEFDIGLSKGRNILLQNVKTKYFLLCDDDFEFDERTDIDKALNIIKNNNIDILGGAIYEKVEVNSIISLLLLFKNPKRLLKFILGYESTRIYNGFFDIKKNEVTGKFNSNPADFSINEFYKVDIVTNFFIANTEKIKAINGWQPEEVKLGEHTIFFIRCKQNGIKVAYSSYFGVKHHPFRTLSYHKYRKRSEEMTECGFKFFEINSYKSYDSNGKLLSEYVNSEKI